MGVTKAASRSKTAAAATFVEPSPGSTDKPPRRVQGLLVVKDEPVSSPLSELLGSPVYFQGRRRLTLEDQQVVVGCADCDFVGDNGRAGEVITHRVDAHGAKRGGARARPESDGGADVATLTVPVQSLGLSLGEIIELATQIGGWEQVLERVREDRDELRTKLLEQRQEAAVREKELLRQLAEKDRDLAKIRRSLGRLIGTEDSHAAA
jgi:hypothetical protein